MVDIIDNIPYNSKISGYCVMVRHHFTRYLINNSMKYYYYTYQITNLINGKIYVGTHKTKDLEDGYMGSGKVLKYAIEKHGIDNFRKDILEYHNTPEQMFAKEKEIVNEDFLERDDVYNLRRGGFGGFDHINKSGIPKMLGKKHTEETKQKLSEQKKGKNNAMFGRKHTEETIAKISKAKLGSKLKSQPVKSEEHKEKLRKANLGKTHAIATCPHCGKTGGARGIKRWHKKCAGIV